MRCQLCGSKDDDAVWYSCLLVCPKCKQRLIGRMEEKKREILKYGRKD